MKKILLIAIFYNLCMLCNAQITAGFSFGLAEYKWDRNPTTNSPEYVKRSVGSMLLNLAPGLHITMGGEKFLLATEGYCNYSPFAYDWNQKKGFGAFTLGGSAKIGIKGILFGYGIEKTKTELYLRPTEFKDITRKFYNMQYVYLGGIMNKDERGRAEQYIKVGFGKNTAMCIEFGIKYYFYFSDLY